MATIKTRRQLYNKITEILDPDSNIGMEFPIELNYQARLGEPEFNIIIERVEKDHFIDENGQKWVKAE